METENPKTASQNSALHTKIEIQEQEIERLNEEVKKLRKCVRGVNVLGRALKETKKENERLLQSSMSEEIATDFENSTEPQSITSTTQRSDKNESEKQTSLPDMEALGKVISTYDMESIDDFSDQDDKNESDTNISEVSEQTHSNEESNDKDSGQEDSDKNDQNIKKDGEKTEQSTSDDDKSSLVKVSNQIQSDNEINKISDQPYLNQVSNDNDNGQVESDTNDQNKKDGEKTDDSAKSSLNDDKTSLVKLSNDIAINEISEQPHLYQEPNDKDNGQVESNPDAEKPSGDDYTGTNENVVQVVTNSMNRGSSDIRKNGESTGILDQPQNGTIGIPGMNSNVKDPECNKHRDREEKQGNVKRKEMVTETDNTDLKNRCEILTKENAKLKLEFRKVLKVNNEWESFWKTKNSSITKDMKEKDDIIAGLQKFKIEHETCAKDTANKMDKERNAKKMDTKVVEKMLFTDERVNELENLVEQQRKEIAEEHQKYERTHKLARSLLQQNKELSEEVKRLNGTLQTKVELYKSLQLSIASGGPGSLHNGHTNEEDLHQLTEPPAIEQTQMLRSGLEYNEEDHQRQGTGPLQQSLEVEEDHHHHQQSEQQVNGDESMSAEELRERIMLLKEQKNAYESDFKKERRDREEVVSKLERTKERLERAKQKVKQKQSNRGPHPPFSNYVALQAPGRHQPVAYIYPPNERNQLVAHGVQERPPQRNDWYRHSDQHVIGARDGDPPCLCPRHHYHRP